MSAFVSINSDSESRALRRRSSNVSAWMAHLPQTMHQGSQAEQELEDVEMLPPAHMVESRHGLSDVLAFLSIIRNEIMIITYLLGDSPSSEVADQVILIALA